MQEGKTSDTPKELDSPAKVVLFHYFGEDINKAMMVHDAVVEYSPNGWRGDSAKENIIKEEIYKVLNDFDETVKVFEVIKEQNEYLR